MLYVRFFLLNSLGKLHGEHHRPKSGPEISILINHPLLIFIEDTDRSVFFYVTFVLIVIIYSFHKFFVGVLFVQLENPK